MKLYATPLSHFARKVRVLMDLYAIPYEMIHVGNVAEINMDKLGDNPLMQVPVLLDGQTWLIDSDHIAEYIVKKFDPDDRYNVLISEPFDLNARAIMNGIMDNEVKIVLAQRTELPTEKYAYFDKARQSINNALLWLEQNSHQFSPATPGYREIHLVCLWQHLEYYNMVPLNYPHLGKLVQQIAELPQLIESAPAEPA
ncbi:glutathione S-transferase family protein [Marinicella sp. W31]|uniref:glutathione S-transferase family protein n=1 Tax=Marinicella sp. W31 TaxID=3023713 RepID=UPI0037565669